METTQSQLLSIFMIGYRPSFFHSPPTANPKNVSIASQNYLILQHWWIIPPSAKHIVYIKGRNFRGANFRGIQFREFGPES